MATGISENTPFDCEELSVLQTVIKSQMSSIDTCMRINPQKIWQTDEKHSSLKSVLETIKIKIQFYEKH